MLAFAEDVVDENGSNGERGSRLATFLFKCKDGSHWDGDKRERKEEKKTTRKIITIDRVCRRVHTQSGFGRENGRYELDIAWSKRGGHLKRRTGEPGEHVGSGCAQE